MARGRRLVGGLLMVVLAAAVFAAVRFQVVEAFQDRLVTDFTIGDAQFSAPGIFAWPRLSEHEAISSCDACPETPGITALYGLLRSDPGIDQFLVGYHVYALTAADVHLPELVWIVQWPVSPSCRDYPASPHSERCASYELIDDATGWAIDAGRYLER